ncbi:DHA2 family efflux MFS transporter permease subunit [Pseudonocardia eucalypti]|uniref:DHA2 family efflux MFS transporter permease subunit n=1 Tax=Pseudonocardia eucalypti TaxID=648755 RepID=A0ABP9PL79_9PSEU|nr:EmrB/QacA subfamily drug resistance transporter [Pseudonocardia eucalypti]
MAKPGWLIPLLVLIVGMFMSVLDISIVNVAIPTMQRDFGTTVDDIEWVSTAYTLALGVVVPMSGWLGDRIGLTRIYLYSLVGFALTSALCGLAWDLPSMVAFRILQAVPGGVLPVVTVSLLMSIVPREQIGTAMGIYGQGVVVAPAIGPTLGGYLVEYVDWRLIFLINVPAGVLGVIAGYLVLPRTPPGPARPFDWWGFVAAATGLFALLLAVSEGQSWGWDSYRIRMLLVFAVLALALFVVIELAVEHPLIDLRVFRNWMFVNSLLLISVLSVGLFAVLFYLPLFMQQGQGIQPLRVGLILLPEAVVMGLLMPVAGRLYDLIGPRWPGVIGLAIAAYGGFLLCGIGPAMSEGDVILWTCVRAFGNGLAMMPIMTAGIAAIPPAQVGSASLVNNIVMRASSALGLAVMTVLATAQQAQLSADRAALIQVGNPDLAAHGISPDDPRSLYGYYRAVQLDVLGQAYSNVFLVAAVLTCVGIGLAALMHKPSVPPPPPATPPRAGDEPEPGRAALAAATH